MKVYSEIKETIKKAIPVLENSYFDFSATPENQPGDLGLACFRLASILNEKPIETAKKIASLIYPSIIIKVETVGPYVNFTLDRNVFSGDVLSDIAEKKGNYGSDLSGKGKKVLLEHTSINPNASPHIGRARNGVIGDVFARLFRFEGYDVNVHYYVNDMGKQIGLLALQSGNKENLSFDDILSEYVEANARAKSDPDFEAKGLDLLIRMENGDPEVRRIFKRIVDICLNGQLEVLSRMGLSYDTFDRESSFLGDKRMAEVIDMLREKGAIFTDAEGRTVVDLAPIGYNREEGRYIVLLRANGSSMYMYRDIAYTLEKIERAEDYNYIVLGEDHKMYFEQLSIIIKALGRKIPDPIFYSYILLKDGKMSTRQGNVVLLSDFLDETIKLAYDRVNEQWADIPENEKKEIARKIGIGAVRYTILSVKPGKNVIFDWESALSFSGDSGPYIQYSCTRISSILRKYGKEPEIKPVEISISKDAEWKLILGLANVENEIKAALETKNPAILANSALDIAKRFSIFYNECSVLNAENDNIIQSRILLCIGVRRTLENLLGILGIEAPERM